MKKILTIDDKKIELNIFGTNKKALILLPGWTHNFQFETKFIQELTKTYKVVTISYPGYSESEENSKSQSINYLAEIIHETIQQLRLTNYNLLGFSMGCEVVIKYLDKYSDKSKTFLISPITHSLLKDTPAYGKLLLSSSLIISLARMISPIKLFIINQATQNISKVTENSNKGGVFKEDRVSQNGAYDTLIATITGYGDPFKFSGQITYIFGDKEVLQDKIIDNLKFKVIRNAGHGAFNTHYKEIADLID